MSSSLELFLRFAHTQVASCINMHHYAEVLSVTLGHPSPLQGGLGNGMCPSPESFSLEMARFRANSVVCFNRNVRLFTAEIMTVTVYCWQLTAVTGVLLLGIVPGTVSESRNCWLSGLGRGLLKIENSCS